MTIHLSKEDLINLVMGVKPRSMTDCDKYTKIGLMKFSGNQWNEDWDWVKSELEKKSESELYDLYVKHK
jgi:hypothetical protein